MKRIRHLLLPSLCALAAALVLANWSQAPLPPGTRVDLLVVEKAARRMTAYSHGSRLRSYPIALGRSPVGAKEREGDNRTPEGRFTIDGRNPASAYHLSLHVSYPAPADVARAKAGGYAPGGAIMIHGMKRGLGWIGRMHTCLDWTRGCIAVTNSQMDELWQVVPNGTPIEIRP